MRPPLHIAFSALTAGMLLFVGGAAAVDGQPSAQREKDNPYGVLIKNGEGIQKAAEILEQVKSPGLQKGLRETGAVFNPRQWTYKNAAEPYRALEAGVGPVKRGASLASQVLPGGVRFVTGVDKVLDGWDIVKPFYKEGFAGIKQVPLAVVDVVANNKASEWGAVYCARTTFCATARFGPKVAIPATILAGIVGGAGSSYTYQYIVKPPIKYVYEYKVEPVVKGLVAGQGKPKERIVSLAVSGPGDADPGDEVQFRAIGDVEMTYSATDSSPGAEGGSRLVTTRAPGVNLSAKVDWKFVGADSVGFGRAAVPCSASGGMVTVVATDPLTGTEASSAFSVSKILLNDLVIEPGTARAKPGDSVSLRVSAFEGKDKCAREAKVSPDDLAWIVSRGGSVTGGTLAIASDAPAGPMTIAARGPNNVLSPTVTIEVEQQRRLQNIVVAVEPTVEVCGIITPTATGVFSDDPKTPRAIPGLRWRFEGDKHSLRGDSQARAEWPDSVIRVIATARAGEADATEVRGEASVRVGGLGARVPYFPIQSIILSNHIKVGGGFVARAIEFSCDAGAKPASGVTWSSSAPGVLACSASGECTGVAPGAAEVNVHYNNRIVTHEPVTVAAVPETAAPTKVDAASTTAAPAKVCAHWSDCPAGYICEAGQCVAKPELSVACSPAAVRVGEAVTVSVTAVYPGRSVDVTGIAKLSRGNPFVPTDAGTYIVSANYQGVIGRCAVKVEGDKPSPCPGDQVRASDGSCVSVSSVDAVMGNYAQRQSERDKSATPLSGVGVGSQNWPPGTTPGERGTRLFGSDSLRNAINRGMSDATRGGQRDTRSDAGTQEPTGGGGSASSGSGGGATGTQVSGGLSGTGTSVPPVKQPTTGVVEKRAWYQFRWVAVRSKPDCPRWIQTVYNNAYLTPSEIPQYIDYVKRQMPTIHVGVAPSATFVSGTVTQVAGPQTKPPAYPGDSVFCSN